MPLDVKNIGTKNFTLKTVRLFRAAFISILFIPAALFSPRAHADEFQFKRVAILPHDTAILNFVWGTEDQHIAVAQSSPKLMIWDVTKKSATSTILRRRWLAPALSFARHDEVLLIPANDEHQDMQGRESAADVHSVADGRKLATIYAPVEIRNATPKYITSYKDGKYIGIAHDQLGKVAIYDANDLSPTKLVELRRMHVASMAFSRGGETLFLAGVDYSESDRVGLRNLTSLRFGGLAAWSLATGEVLWRSIVLKQGLKAIDIHPHENILALGSQPTTLGSQNPNYSNEQAIQDDRDRVVFTTDGGELLDKKLRWPSSEVRSVRFSVDGSLIVTASNAGQIQVWRNADLKLLATLDTRAGPYALAQFSATGRYLAYSSGRNLVVVQLVAPK